MKTIPLKILALVLFFSCSEKQHSNSIITAEKQTTKDTLQIQIAVDKISFYKTDTLLTAKNIWREIEKKVDWFKKDKKAHKSIANIPDDFNSFYTKFISDSNFQKKRIFYETHIGVVAECDTTIIVNKENYTYTNWNFTEFFEKNNYIDNIDGWENNYYFSESTFYYEFKLKEVGIIYQVGFEKIDNEWYMTLDFTNNC